MKQEENKDFLAEDLKLEGVENAENKEAGKEKKKKDGESSTLAAAAAAVLGGAVVGSATAEMPEEEAVVAPEEDLLADAGETVKAHHTETPAVEPEVVTPSEEIVDQPEEINDETISEEKEADDTVTEEKTEEKVEEEEVVKPEEGTDIAENQEEIPIVEVDEAGVENLDIAQLDPVEIKPQVDTDLHADVQMEPIEIPEVPGVEDPTHQIELAYQEKNLIDTDEADSRLFSVKEKTIMQDGETEIPAVNIVDADGNEYLLADKDGDGLYEAIYDSDGEYVAQAKGGISESDIDEALDELSQEEDIFVDDPEAVTDTLIYDEDDSIIEDIEGLDVGDTDLA